MNNWWRVTARQPLLFFVDASAVIPILATVFYLRPITLQLSFYTVLILIVLNFFRLPPVLLWRYIAYTIIPSAFFFSKKITRHTWRNLSHNR